MNDADASDLRSDADFASDLREMIAAWDRIRAAAQRQFPSASEEEIFRITSDAMDAQLGLTNALSKRY